MSPLRSQSGQGTIEYVLVLIVAVAIIMGGLYQLNTAFKSWANNYFGDYLACLLETGELPTIGGSPGDSGTCEQFFKPFNFADGRPLKEGGGGEGEGAEGPSGAERERRSGPSGGSYVPARYGSGRWGGGSGGAGGPGRGANQGRSSAVNTGSTGTSDYGGGYTYYQRPRSQAPRSRLDNKFAFDDQADRQRRIPAGTAKKASENEGSRPAIKLKPNAFKRKSVVTSDTTFTIGNFIRIIIIAAIIIALVMFLGGQALSISKSME